MSNKRQELSDKLMKSIVEQEHELFIDVDSNTSLADYKREVTTDPSVHMLPTPISRLVRDKVYGDSNVIDQFETLYYEYKERGLDLIEELGIDK